MPRLREADAEDMLARCPRCKGNGQVYDLNAEAEVDCPVCDGTGRVTQVEHRRYLGDDAAGPLNASTP